MHRTDDTPSVRSRGVELPDALIRAVRQGQCVAFVGAGLSIPSVPGWPQLVKQMATKRCRDDVLHLLAGREKDAARLEVAVQLLADDLEPEVLAATIRDCCEPPNAGVLSRLEMIRDIPFSAILTTNVDGFLRGWGYRDHLDDAADYAAVLRQGRGWTAWRNWETGAVRRPAMVFELHGNVHDRIDELTFSATQYRKRLFGDANYLAFLRAVFATKTVLFVGFSFSDEYIRLLRSETIALLGHGEHTAFAVMDNVPQALRDHHRRHDGMEVISYDAAGSDHSGFDRILAALRDSTSARAILRRHVQGRSIVWCDDGHDQRNQYGLSVLRDAGAHVLEVFSPDEALDAAARGADLVVTQWAYDHGVGERILVELRQREVAVPVIVFSSGSFANENKRRALSLGAYDYVFDWEPLFERIQHVFEPGTKTGAARYTL